MYFLLLLTQEDFLATFYFLESNSHLLLTTVTVTRSMRQPVGRADWL